jgi:hypothetical protein
MPHKFLLLAFVLFLCARVNAQYVIQGKITNEATAEPVALVSVTVVGSTKGTISNDAGEFSITTDQLPVKIRFDHISYQSAETTLTDNATTIAIKLKIAAVELKEVSVGNPALAIMKLAAAKAGSQMSKQYLGKAFTRQTLVESDKPVLFTESFADVEWQNAGITKTNTVNARYLEGDIAMDYTNTSFVESICAGYINNTLINTPISHKPDSLYRFKLKEYRIYNGKEIAVITCELKDADKLGPAFTGDYYIDTDNDDIIKTDGSITKLKFTTGTALSVKFKELKVISNYKPDANNNMVLDYASLSLKTILKIGFVGVKSSVYNSKTFIINYDKKIDPATLTPIMLKPKLKDIERIKQVAYNPEFWKNNAVIKRTADEDNAVSVLEKLKDKKGNMN